MEKITVEQMKELVFSAIGEASMCWDPIPSGVFNSTRAKEVGERLIAALAKAYQIEGNTDSECWKDMAAQMSRNAEYYRGLVVKIGAMLGEQAYMSDDGSVQADVLCAKVPELVAEVLKAPDDEVLVSREEVLKILRATMCEMACKDDMITAVYNLPRGHNASDKGAK